MGSVSRNAKLVLKPATSFKRQTLLKRVGETHQNSVKCLYGGPNGGPKGGPNGSPKGDPNGSPKGGPNGSPKGGPNRCPK